MIRVCYKLGNAGIKWRNSDWTWDDCQLVSECIRWFEASTLWSQAGWMWSECSASFHPPIPPVVSIGSLQPLGLDATTLIQPWLIEPYSPYRAGEKKKKIVRLICRIKGIEYDESKEAKDLRIAIEDIKLMIDKTKNINLDMKME